MKKIFLTLLALASITGASAEAEGFWHGDINNDGKVNIADMTILIRYLGNSSATLPDGTIIARADVNKDGSTNLDDLTLLTQMVTGKTDLIREEKPTAIPFAGQGSGTPEAADDVQF